MNGNILKIDMSKYVLVLKIFRQKEKTVYHVIIIILSVVLFHYDYS